MDIDTLTLAGSLGIARNDLTLILQGQRYATHNCAAMIDHALSGNDPHFDERWERRVQLTFDPARAVLWQRAGVTSDDLMKLWHISAAAYCWDRIRGTLWFSDQQWIDLQTWLKDHPDIAKYLRGDLIVAQIQYRLIKPVSQPKLKNDPLGERHAR